MLDQDREPVVTICLLAALVDGARSPEEQAQFERIMAHLGGTPVADGNASLAETVGRLSSPETRRLAYEMAVSVVYADGDVNDREREFLDELRAAIELAENGVDGLDEEARTLAEAPLGPPPPEPDKDRRAVPRSLFASQGGIPMGSPDAPLDNFIRIALVHDRDVLLIFLSVIEIDVDGDFPSNLSVNPNLQLLLEFKIALTGGETLRTGVAGIRVFGARIRHPDRLST